VNVGQQGQVNQGLLDRLTQAALMVSSAVVQQLRRAGIGRAIRTVYGARICRLVNNWRAFLYVARELHCTILVVQNNFAML
jgi:hypothetical protein